MVAENSMVRSHAGCRPRADRTARRRWQRTRRPGHRRQGAAAAGADPGARLPACTPLSPPLNDDVAGGLNLAERRVGGEPLYAGLIDANPLLIFVLNLLPRRSVRGRRLAWCR